MGTRSRNAPCPCGSGRKYKRCCLPHEQPAQPGDRFEDEVGRRISTWSTTEHQDEIDAALEEFGVREGDVMDDADLQLFVTWFNSDRETLDGATPSERYAARPELDEREREVASRIAEARLGLHRVRAVEAGHWIELEDVVRGMTVRVRSLGVSREATRWDVLLCRVMAGQPLPSLWGPVLFFRPDEERELIAELERLATAHGLRRDPEGLERTFRAGALELVRFVPPSRGVEPSFFTAEGDTVVHAHAVWSIADPDAALERLDAPPELLWVGESDDEPGEVIQWTGDRARLIARRPPLPPGALCFESTYTELPGRIGLATFTLTDAELRCDAISEPRLEGAVELVARCLGDLAELDERTVSPFKPDRSPDRQRPPREPPPGLTRAESRRLQRELLEDRYREWLDEPLETLDGRTPREAARVGPRAELELLLRGIENRAERARRSGTTWPEMTWLRRELGLSEDLAA